MVTDITKPDEQRNIQRMDYPPSGHRGSTKGWWVRVMRSNETFSRFFNDNKYGGKDKALEKAKQYRDKIEEENEGLLGLGYHPFKTPRNKSGVVGVYKVESTLVSAK